MKSAPALLLLLIALPWLVLRLPGRASLDLYDVQDISYGMSDMPGVDIALAGASPDVFDVRTWCLEDLAEAVRPFAPGRPVQGQNGLLIVRATRVQHAAVRLRLAAARAWIRAQEEAHRLLSRILAG